MTKLGEAIKELKVSIDKLEIRQILDISYKLLGIHPENEAYRDQIVLFRASFKDLKSQESFMARDVYLMSLRRQRYLIVQFLSSLEDELGKNSEEDTQLTDELEVWFRNEMDQKENSNSYLIVSIFLIVVILATGIGALTMNGFTWFPDFSFSAPSGTLVVTDTTSSSVVSVDSVAKPPAAAPSHNERGPNPPIGRGPLEKKRPLYELEIFTSPGYVEIYEGDEFLGSTGRDDGAKMEVIRLTEGRHVLRFRKDNFKTMKKIVYIPQDMPRLPIILQPQ